MIGTLVNTSLCGVSYQLTLMMKESHSEIPEDEFPNLVKLIQTNLEDTIKTFAYMEYVKRKDKEGEYNDIL
jgi:hypothetical protein